MRARRWQGGRQRDGRLRRERERRARAKCGRSLVVADLHGAGRPDGTRKTDPIWETRLRVDFGLRDVLDERGSDLLGFPLPGRSLAVSLALQSD